MDEKWRVSRVELLEGGLLYGFVLYDQRGTPSVSFGYSDRAKAKLGRNHVAAEQSCAAFETWFLDPTCRQTHVKKVARTKHQLAHN
jgi:hypothetical protein